MAFNIEENFDIQAPITQVWAFLIDPRRVVVCLPGAELTDTIDERTYAGRVRVKVGPVTATYKGTARLDEVDESAYVMRLSGEGKESTGAGSAKMAMVGRLSALANGVTRVQVVADIDVAGKMAQFGRGLMEDVSRQLFRQFGVSMQEALVQPVTTPLPMGSADTPATIAASAPDAPLRTEINESSRLAAPAAPVSVLSLVFKALWSRVRRLFGSRNIRP
ncbi:MAG: SRPBCC family protein [Rhodothermales bacterium]|nr:SRPBCC family protein [Rhodothermales bacterium]